MGKAFVYESIRPNRDCICRRRLKKLFIVSVSLSVGSALWFVEAPGSRVMCISKVVSRRNCYLLLLWFKSA